LQSIETYSLNDLSKNEFLGELYKRYGKKLYAYAIRSWNLGEDDAWDLVYKTLYKVIDSYKDYTFINEEKFASFVFRIFINYLRNHYQLAKKINEKLPMTDVDSNDLQNKAGEMTTDNSNPRLKTLSEELEKMEDWQRMLLLMRSDGHPYSDIAKLIDKPENQLKVYYQRLKEQLTKKLNGE
jgi:RNA polymerase sigma-70 factor, ECF subfamily